MAIEVVSAVIEARRGPWSKADLMVLVMLANYAHPNGTNIFPSIGVLARACRLKERQVQQSIKDLLSDEVLILVKAANESGFGGRRTNEYCINMVRVQNMQGCKICGGARCDDRGCHEVAHPRKKQQGTGAENNRGRVQKTARHIDRPVNRPVNDLGAGSPRAPERRGDPALWGKIAAALEPKLLTKLLAYEPTLQQEAGRVVVAFPKAFCERFAMPLRRDLRAILGQVDFTFAGRAPQGEQAA